jgi:DnaK suppressor protein
MQLDSDEVRRRLEAERAELQSLEAEAAGSRPSVTHDQTEVGRLARIGAIQSHEMALATERRRRDRLARIDAALKRLGNGEFGVCVSCGEDIPEKRLEVDLTTPTCVKCAK